LQNSTKELVCTTSSSHGACESLSWDLKPKAQCPSLMPSSAPTADSVVHRLRALIRGLLSGDDVKAFMAAQQSRDESRLSVVSVIGAAQSELGLEVGL
jgi:hypothetical protein